MTTFTASEVVAKLRERFASGNDVPVPDVRLTRAEFDVTADRLEADDKAVPVAYAEFTDGGCIRMWSRQYEERLPGTRMIPLYTHPSDTERLAEALRAKIRRLRNMPNGEFQLAASIFADDLERILDAHSAQAQLPINHSDEEPYPDAAKDPFWKVPGMVDTRPKAQTPATSVPDGFLRHVAAVCMGAVENCRPKASLLPEDPQEHNGGLCLNELTHIAGEIDRMLAAQENPNG